MCIDFLLCVFQGSGLTRRDASSRQFGGGGGCTDPFSVFTFLAFALAVMDLVMEMNRYVIYINFIMALIDITVREGVKTPSHGKCPLGGRGAGWGVPPFR